MVVKIPKGYIFFTLVTGFVFILHLQIALSLNIHGDSKFHTLFAKESVEKGYLEKSQSHRIYSIEADSRTYVPIAYPLTSESLFSILYLFGGENLLKMYSPIFATLIFLMIFLCIREIGTVAASIFSLISVLSIDERLIMAPLIEPFVVLLLLTAILYLKKYFEDKKGATLAISAIFIGAVVTVKQQGLVVSLVILGFLLIYFLLKTIINNNTLLNNTKHFLIILFLTISISFPAIIEQINRTGTFGFSPGGTDISKSIPFSSFIENLLTSKFETNPDSVKAIKETVNYRRTDQNIYDKANELLLAPFLFYRSKAMFSGNVLIKQIFYLITLVVLPIGVFNIIFKSNRKLRNRKFWILAFILIIIEIFTSYVLKTPITQYHSFGVVIGTLLIFTFAYSLSKEFKLVSIILTSSLLLFSILGYITYIYPLWFDSGREDSYHLEGYKRIGEFVQKNTPKDVIFLAAETSFRYYSKRDSIWLNEAIGHKVREILTTKDENLTLKLLSELDTEYIVINKEQLNRFGVGDYLPPDGLITYINTSNHFSKIYDPYDNGDMALYKVVY